MDATAAHHHHAAQDAAREPATDPVCGMQVDPATSRHRFEHAGQVFHFCCAGCREKFAPIPPPICSPSHLRPRSSPPPTSGDPPPAPAGTLYTCPMHPEVRQAAPRQLPALRHGVEPLVATGEAAPDHELIEMRDGCGSAPRWPSRWCVGDGRPPAGLATLVLTASRLLGAARHRHAGGAVGRAAVLPARLGLGGEPQPQHVQPDRAGHRSRLSLQPGRDAGAGPVPCRIPRRACRRRQAAQSRSISRPPR